MRTVYFYLCFIIDLIGKGFKEIKLNSIKKHKTTEEVDAYLAKVVRDWSNFVIRIAGLNLTVIGKENIPKEPCVFVGNHQSNLDIPVILANMNSLTGAVAKKEMEKIPVMSYWMRQIHSVFMDRENPREALKSISEGVENLKNGYSMIIFPEGTRSRSNNIGEFKKGSMRLAIKAGVPIVPITFYDTHKAMEGNNGKVKKANAKLIFDKPIYMDKMSKEEKAEISEVVKNIIKTNINMEDKKRSSL
ncbi:1-acyl-sn-glycerol-3-phosphate acyltransferase [Clostridium sp. FP2]|uniref:lysophospholipid acyltransferase family protein n=1 Tax=Clostridium TaxID=1485 RepID=UPI0013E93BBC|nr:MULTISPECIES: lysophospholipid acyltransferase family protein [Clostridium]MBW9156752.1 1-acyl-sn-glycerol-3-phosphate acyltransferase [Clostridium tagluense]MBZ9625118.1 1-acyl-sn-glycerol-3-phosphate acyltransferase [Clostridium sp. FP2]WLC64909.1 1-acyl-sn-glycerol-3-phosphate acyltransferase [Clostridium tagluense]